MTISGNNNQFLVFIYIPVPNPSRAQGFFPAFLFVLPNKGCINFETVFFPKPEVYFTCLFGEGLPIITRAFFIYSEVGVNSLAFFFKSESSS